MESQRDSSFHRDASPPRSSLSSTSESRSKFGSLSASDEDVGVLQKQYQDVGADFQKRAMDWPVYVPQGLCAAMPKPVNVGAFTPRSEFPRYPEPPHFGPHGCYGNPHLWKPSGDLPLGMLANQLRGNDYFIPEQPHRGERQPGNGSCYPIPGPRRLFEIPPKHFPLAPPCLPTTMHIYSNRKVNFAGSIVPFIIEVFNPPHRVNMRSHMFQAIAQSPKGKEISCRIRSSDCYVFDTFVGTFKTEDEAGNYKIRVRATVPPSNVLAVKQDLKQLSNNVIYCSASVPVCKNYGTDAQRECLQIPCGLPKHGQDNASAESQRGPDFPCKFWGLTCDLRNNNLLYTDRETHQVFCVSPNGDIIFKFGRNSRAPTHQHLCRPAGIAFDEVHNRYIVSDKDNHRICFFSLDGQFLTSFGLRGHDNGFFEYPWDVAVAPNGALAVSDSKNKRIQIFDSQGHFTGKYTVYEVNPFQYRTQFDYPRGVCFDNTGNYIYATDFNVNNVMQIPMDFAGHNKLLPPGTLQRPQGIAMDNIGNLLVADSRHDCIRYLNTRGDHLYTVREIVKKQLSFPINITTMAGGFVAVLNGSGNIFIF